MTLNTKQLVNRGKSSNVRMIQEERTVAYRPPRCITKIDHITLAIGVLISRNRFVFPSRGQ